jgi:hypothetical protein
MAKKESVELTSMGRENLEKAGLPIIFEDWLTLVEQQLGRIPRKDKYRVSFMHGRTPEQAIELAKADLAADAIVCEVLKRCHEEFKKISPNAFPFGSGHLAECVAIKLQRCY